MQFNHVLFYMNDIILSSSHSDVFLYRICYIIYCSNGIYRLIIGKKELKLSLRIWSENKLESFRNFLKVIVHFIKLQMFKINISYILILSLE